MRHREVDPDDAIDRVLNAICEVDPPEGMQQRVLRGARLHAGPRHQPALPFALRSRYTWMVATASAAVIALAIFLTIARNHRSPQIAAGPPEHSRQAVAAIMEARVAPTPLARARPQLGFGSGPRQGSGPRSEIGPGRTPPEEGSAPVEPVHNEDALALSEMNAPSHPAPPMPLTEQERLLMVILYKDDPVELAMLDPQIRNSEDAGEKLDFERFFKQSPKIVEIKLPITIKQTTGDEK